MKLGTRLEHWLASRLLRRDAITLTQRNVYILPTRAGLLLGITLLVLLLASINYQLNLGYILTFSLTGSAVVGMYVCHGTLRGLSMHLIAPEPHFAGDTAQIAIKLISARQSVRHGIGLAIAGSQQWSWTDVPAQGQCQLTVAFPVGQRGYRPLPTLTAETRFPLGTFRVWTIWRPAAQVLVYPAPERHPPPLPSGEALNGQAGPPSQHPSDEADGVRAYRRGDPLKRIVWKKAAKSDALVSRDSEAVHGAELWLDLAQARAAGAREEQLSRLCAWVLAAEQQGLVYGLQLDSTRIAPATGDAHRLACLRALATCPPADQAL